MDPRPACWSALSTERLRQRLVAPLRGVYSGAFHQRVSRLPCRTAGTNTELSPAWQETPSGNRRIKARHIFPWTKEAGAELPQRMASLSRPHHCYALCQAAASGRSYSALSSTSDVRKVARGYTSNGRLSSGSVGNRIASASRRLLSNSSFNRAAIRLRVASGERLRSCSHEMLLLG